MRWAWAAGIVVATVGMAVGAVEACNLGPDNICDPSYYDYGTSDPGYLAHCIVPDDAGCCPPGFMIADPSYPTWCAPTDAGDGCDARGASDAGDAATDGPIGSCTEQCLPLPPQDWANPSLAWIGPELQAPPCPANAPVEGPDGYADLNAPDLCGACECDPPVGSCSLPGTLTANSTACPGTDPVTAHTSFDPPDGGWDGSCSANDAIDGGALCDGGTCVQSLTIAPLTVKEIGCTPTQAPITKDPPTWGTFARVCRGMPVGGCGNNGLVCSPSLAPGFRVCVYQKDDNDCPGSPYTEKHILYKHFQDSRSCSPCSCGPPSGSVCSSEISIYGDGACMSASPNANPVDSTKPVCVDVITGAALGSKSATPPTYNPGACQPSGGPIGSADPTGPLTLCCIPPL